MLLFALALPAASGFTSECGGTEDPCMNEDNWKECRNLELNGCDQIAILKSCPLQFVCGDIDGEEVGSPVKADGWLNPEPEEGNVSDYPIMVNESPELTIDPPDACVGLYVYDDDKCSGKPIRILSFSTWSYPGSPCYHDATLRRMSVENQYCNLKTGNWHETVILGSTTCQGPRHWYDWGKEFDLTFTTDSCIDGLSLKGCMVGACPSKEVDRESRDSPPRA